MRAERILAAAALASALPTAGLAQAVSEIHVGADVLPHEVVGDTVYVETWSGAATVVFDFGDAAPPATPRVEPLLHVHARVVRVETPRLSGRFLEVPLTFLTPGSAGFTLVVEDADTTAFYIARRPFVERGDRCLIVEADGLPVPDPAGEILQVELLPSGRILPRGDEGWRVPDALGGDRTLRLGMSKPFRTGSGWTEDLDYCVRSARAPVQPAVLIAGQDTLRRLYAGESPFVRFETADDGPLRTASEFRLRSWDDRAIGSLHRTSGRDVWLRLADDAPAGPRPLVVNAADRPIYEILADVHGRPMVREVRVTRVDFPTDSLVPGTVVEVWAGDDLGVRIEGENLGGLSPAWNSRRVDGRIDTEEPGAVAMTLEIDPAAGLGDRYVLRAPRLPEPLIELRVIRDPRRAAFFARLGPDCATGPRLGELSTTPVEGLRRVSVRLCPEDPDAPRGPQYFEVTATLRSPELAAPKTATDRVVVLRDARSGWDDPDYRPVTALSPTDFFDDLVEVGGAGSVITIVATHAPSKHRGGAATAPAGRLVENGWRITAEADALPDYFHLFDDGSSDSELSTGALTFEWTRYRDGAPWFFSPHFGLARLQSLSSSSQRLGMYLGGSLRIDKLFLEIGVGFTNKGELLLRGGPAVGRFGLWGSGT